MIIKFNVIVAFVGKSNYTHLQPNQYKDLWSYRPTVYMKLCLGAIHRLCCVKRGGGRVKYCQFYLVKSRLREGEGVKNCWFWDDIVYGRPLSRVLTTILSSHILYICLQCLAKYQESRCICILISVCLWNFKDGGSRLVRV